jgi:tRNA-splicing ligase RtcB
MDVTVTRKGKYELVIEKQDRMLVEAPIFTSDKIRLETDAIEQLKNAASLPSVFRAFGMPDIHVGYGVPIGSVVATKDIVIPAAVGYDINCGMRVLTTPMKADAREAVRIAESIRRDIPLGEGKRNISLPVDDFRTVAERGVKGLRKVSRKEGRVWDVRDEKEENEDIQKIEEFGSMDGDCSAVSQRALERGKSQLATLGGGNHFIEIQEVQKLFDTKLAERFGLYQGQMVVMIHTGSRGFGHQIAGDYMRKATGVSLDRAPSKDLCFLDAGTDLAADYLAAMHCAANFGFVNRQLMTILVRHDLRRLYGEPNMPLPIIYDVAHNIVKLEEHFGQQVWVHRKGATRAFPKSRMAGTVYADVGQPVLIPGSMGTASYVLLGTEESARTLNSVNHGAGRTMSRTKAAGFVTRKGKVKKTGAISDEEFEKSMRGIHLICENRFAIKEEAPQAYKDIDEVIHVVAEAGLARIVARMVPLAVLKG